MAQNNRNNCQHTVIPIINEEHIPFGQQPRDHRTTDSRELTNAEIDRRILPHKPNRFDRTDLMDFLNGALIIIFCYSCVTIIPSITAFYLLITRENRRNEIIYCCCHLDVNRDAQEEGRVAVPSDEQAEFETAQNNLGGQEQVEIINDPNNTTIVLTQNHDSGHSIESLDESHACDSSGDDELISGSENSISSSDEADSNDEEFSDRSWSPVENLSSIVQRHVETNQNEQPSGSDHQAFDREAHARALGSDDAHPALAPIHIPARKLTIIFHLHITPSDTNST